uniref:Putative secreted protein n=1 Tax=Amblyomma cajennense TaxID=34607 RepID=A0A023FC66_AMBCJ
MTPLVIRRLKTSPFKASRSLFPILRMTSSLQRLRNLVLVMLAASGRTPSVACPLAHIQDAIFFFCGHDVASGRQRCWRDLRNTVKRIDTGEPAPLYSSHHLFTGSAAIASLSLKSLPLPQHMNAAPGVASFNRVRSAVSSTLRASPARNARSAAWLAYVSCRDMLPTRCVKFLSEDNAKDEALTAATRYDLLVKPSSSMITSTVAGSSDTLATPRTRTLFTKALNLKVAVTRDHTSRILLL